MFIYTVGDIIELFVLAVFVLLFSVNSIITLIRQNRCKHEKYYGDSSCSAICCNCSKDLGFIGNVRKTNKED